MVELPTKCKAAVIVEFNKPLEIIELDVPLDIESNAILVKNEMAGICGSDIHMWRGRTGGAAKARFPLILGHETVGRIVKLGDGRKHDCAGATLKVGDRIIWSHVFCGECYWCKIAHQPNICSNRIGSGFRCCYEYPYLCGGYAEYSYLVPKTEVVKIPEELTNDEVVGVPCAFRTNVAAYENLGGYGLQDSVVIQGAGPISLFALVLAKEGGAGKIIIVGAPQNRLDLAKKWGADIAINIEEYPDAATRKQMILDLTEGIGADVVVEGSGGRTAFGEGLEIIRKGGKYVVVGQISFEHTNTIKPALITINHLTIIGQNCAVISQYRTALRIIQNKRNVYNFADLITNKYKLEQVNEALLAMEEGKEIKPVLVP
ncbi:MAG: zinc-binding dehydrogenase [Dehalococcoidia bacterium]|nr:MAG: zinc-binding dehydrogenase [Dehalococcoidia bacterium]